jgi:hypothetical protein
MYAIDFCQRLCQLVQLTVKVTSLVLFLAVNPHVNTNYGTHVSDFQYTII